MRIADDISHCSKISWVLFVLNCIPHVSGEHVCLQRRVAIIAAGRACPVLTSASPFCYRGGDFSTNKSYGIAQHRRRVVVVASTRPCGAARRRLDLRQCDSGCVSVRVRAQCVRTQALALLGSDANLKPCGRRTDTVTGGLPPGCRRGLPRSRL